MSRKTIQDLAVEVAGSYDAFMAIKHPLPPWRDAFDQSDSGRLFMAKCSGKPGTQQFAEFLQAATDGIVDLRASERIHPNDPTALFGPLDGDRWLLVGQQLTPRKPNADLALSFINRIRTRGAQRELDPTESGWTSDDVVTEARRLGWIG